MIGSQPGANEQVVVHNQVIHYTESGRNFGFLTFNLSATTDADGNFTFDKVPPGSCTVDHAPAKENTSFSSDNTMITVTSGAVTQVTLGGTGRTIIGKIALPANATSIDWQATPIRMHTKFANAPTVRPKREDFPSFEAFLSASDTFFHIFQKQKRFQTFCTSDGSFEISNVPAGTYELKIEIRDTGKNSAAPRDGTDRSPVLDSLTREIVVTDDKSPDPIDLGTVELAPQPASVTAR